MPQPINIEKQRREQLRWLIMTALDAARPIGANEQLILSVVRELIADLTPRELRRELDYLEERGLIKLAHKDSPTWLAELTRDGIDVVEYTCDCDPGIARPPKYW
jgi:hypothetical protein